MIHFSLVLSAGPVQQWTGPFSSARHTTPNQYFPLSRRARVERIGWAGPREGNRAGNARSRAVPSRPHGGTFCKQNL